MRAVRMLSMVVLLSVFAATGAFAHHERPDVERLEGDDAVTRALAWSQWQWEDGGAQDAILGRSDDFSDSLASATLQSAHGAPLLLTPTNVLDPRVAAELQRLEVETVHVLGGEGAISGTVEQLLVGQGYEVERYAGSNRVQTAIEVARSVYDPERTFNTGTAVLARAFGDGSQGFADALGAGALAARFIYHPLLITPGESLDQGVAAFLQETKVTEVYLAGGTAALSANVETQLRNLGITTIRVSGPDRAATAAEMNEHRRIEAAEADSVILVEGYTDDAWASGLAASGPANMHQAQQAGSPGVPGAAPPYWAALLLTQGDALPAVTASYLGEVPDGVPLVCGPGVSQAACDQAATILGH